MESCDTPPSAEEHAPDEVADSEAPLPDDPNRLARLKLDTEDEQELNPLDVQPELEEVRKVADDPEHEERDAAAAPV